MVFFFFFAVQYVHLYNFRGSQGSYESMLRKILHVCCTKISYYCQLSPNYYCNRKKIFGTHIKGSRTLLIMSAVAVGSVLIKNCVKIYMHYYKCNSYIIIWQHMSHSFINDLRMACIDLDLIKPYLFTWIL